MKTSISEKIAYGMGDVACNVVYALTSGLIVYFYTNVIGVSAGVVGTILLVSRVFDGVSDLLIAQLMDKINSRHGKARAWILWMAAPYAVSATALFAVPSHAGKMVQAIYIFVTYNLCTTVVYTALNLPYSAMAPLTGTAILAPAYSTYRIELGEISSYPRGYKENGGIFCHNNPWISIANAIAGNDDEAFAVYQRNCPAYVEDKSDVRKVEPYVYCQMVAGPEAATPGEGKNSWLTGTAAWTFVVRNTAYPYVFLIRNP